MTEGVKIEKVFTCKVKFELDFERLVKVQLLSGGVDGGSSVKHDEPNGFRVLVAMNVVDDNMNARLM